MRKLTNLMLVSLLFGYSHASYALLITSGDISTEGLGDFEAEVNWDGSQLSVDLTNLSSIDNGGFITGLLMRLPNGATFDLGWTNSDLDFLPAPDGPYAGSPYGDFDYGYALGGDFLGGGRPGGGIAAGESAQFIFSDWDLLGPLTTEDFVANFETALETDTNFLVRFRGFDDGGSDKVIGVYGEIEEPPPSDPPNLPPTPPSAEIPTPSTVWLFLMGFGALVLRKRWNKSKQK